jgi:hypothetical protein
MARSILVARGLGRFGQAAAFTLAQGGHKVFVGFPQLGGPPHKKAVEFALSGDLDLHAVQLDLSDSASISRTLDLVLGEAYGLDALVHELEPLNPVRMAPAGDINENREDWHRKDLGVSLEQTVIAHMSRQRNGLLARIAYPSTAGTTLPGPLRIGAEDESKPAQLARLGIDCCTIFPRLSLQSRTSSEINPSYVAKLIAELVSRPGGERPQRIFVHSSNQKIIRRARKRSSERASGLTASHLARTPVAAG